MLYYIDILTARSALTIMALAVAVLSIPSPMWNSDAFTYNRLKHVDLDESSSSQAEEQAPHQTFFSFRYEPSLSMHSEPSPWNHFGSQSDVWTSKPSEQHDLGTPQHTQQSFDSIMPMQSPDSLHVLTAQPDRRYGTLDDIVGGFGGRELPVRGTEGSSMDHVVQTGLDESSPSRSSSGAVRIDQPITGAANQGKISTQRFPETVRGIIWTGSPGFTRKGARNHVLQNSNTAEWQSYINKAYFADQLEWLPVTVEEVQSLKLGLSKARKQYVLPSLAAGVPILRFHRHATGGQFLLRYRAWPKLQHGGTVLSIWSDPVLQPKVSPLDHDQYVSYFYGLAQLKPENQMTAVNHLEALLSLCPSPRFLRL